MNLLNNNRSDSEFEIIAESSNNLRIELIKQIGSNDRIQIIDLSKELRDEFGEDALITNNNLDNRIPDAVTYGQMRDLVYQFLKKNPQIRHHDIELIIIKTWL